MLSALFTRAFRSAIQMGRTFTPPIGTPHGIASLERMELNGYPQWLLIRGHDVSKPVLLFVHGGPGSAETWFAHHSMRELERHFVCVNWDQRGAGKSFRPGPPPDTMTMGHFIADAITLIEALLKRFHQNKLFLVGHSWGSVLALKIAAARPDLLHGVVGLGQVIDMKRGEEISYRYALENARRSKNRKAVRQLEKIGPPPYKGNDLFIQRRWLSQYKGDTWATDLKGTLSIGLEASEYSIGDFLRFLRGVKFSNKLLWNELMGVNLPRDIPEVSVPVYFLVGRHDYTTPFELVESYFDALKAPTKRLVWFENSAHMPNIEEPGKFQSELLAIAQELLPW